MVREEVSPAVLDDDSAEELDGEELELEEDEELEDELELEDEELLEELLLEDSDCCVTEVWQALSNRALASNSI